VLARVLAIVALLALNGFFVAAEFSVVRSRRSRLEAMARAGDTKARLVLRASGRLARLLSASQFGITLSSIGIGALAEEALSARFAQAFTYLPLPLQLGARAGFGTACALAVVTYGHVVFGELAPRGATINNPERMSRWLVPPLVAFAWLTQPFTWLLSRSAELVLRPFGLRPGDPEENVHSADELRIIVEQSQEGGVLERQDAALIEGVFEFSEKNAREVMTPRTAIDALDLETSLDDALAHVIETQRSRYPVYDESIDNIVGLVLAKDLLPIARDRPRSFTVQGIMRPVHVVPGSREVEEVLADFKRLKVHMAVVLDEYGGTAGIVTMEDLLEEIVGEILDEHRLAERRRPPARLDERQGAQRALRTRRSRGRVHHRRRLHLRRPRPRPRAGRSRDRVARRIHGPLDGRPAHRNVGRGPPLGGRPARSAPQRSVMLPDTRGDLRA